MVIKFKNVCVIASNLNNATLGAGGTISKLVAYGANVYYFAFISNTGALQKGLLESEIFKATSKLGIQKQNVIIFDTKETENSKKSALEALIKYRENIKPDLVLLPSLNSIDKSDDTIVQECLKIFKNTTLLGYEITNNNLSFNTVSFVKLDKMYVQAKCDSLKEYKSSGTSKYTNKEFVFSLARIRGAQIDTEYAESFETIRSIM